MAVAVGGTQRLSLLWGALCTTPQGSILGPALFSIFIQYFCCSKPLSVCPLLSCLSGLGFWAGFFGGFDLICLLRAYCYSIVNSA